MTRLFNGVCAAGRIAYLVLAGTAVFAAWTSGGHCAAWVALGLLSLWYIGESLLALSAGLVVRAYVAACLLAEAAAGVVASCQRRVRARVAMFGASFRRARGDRVFVRRAVATLFLLGFLLSVPVSLLATLPNVPGLTNNNVSPWETVGTKLCELFYGKLGKALAIVAVVIGGLLYAFGEGGSKSQTGGHRVRHRHGAPGARVSHMALRRRFSR